MTGFGTLFAIHLNQELKAVQGIFEGKHPVKMTKLSSFLTLFKGDEQTKPLTVRKAKMAQVQTNKKTSTRRSKSKRALSAPKKVSTKKSIQGEKSYRIYFLIGALVLSAIILMTKTTAHAKSCSDLNHELRAMQKAQSTLLQTMVKKNDSMASTLDQFSESFSVKSKLKKTDLVGMKKSAQAFRRHQDREEKLVERFQNKTAELLDEVESCLRSKTIAAE